MVDPYLAPRPGAKYSRDEDIPFEEQVINYKGVMICQGVGCYSTFDNLIKF